MWNLLFTKYFTAMKNLLLSAAIAGPMAYVLYRSMSEYLQNEALTMFHERMLQVNNDFDAAASL